jgi:hypothetical protein
VSKSNGRRLAFASAACFFGSTFFVGCTDQSVNPPLKTEGAAPVAPDSVKKDEAPKSKRESPRGSAKIGRDPSGVNRGQ